MTDLLGWSDLVDVRLEPPREKALGNWLGGNNQYQPDIGLIEWPFEPTRRHYERNITNGRRYWRDYHRKEFSVLTHELRNVGNGSQADILPLFV